MSRGTISKVIEEINEARAEVQAEEYTMVNVRPGEKVASMLDLMAALSGNSASAFVAEEMSTRLADHAASSYKFADAIMDAAEEALKNDQVLQSECALDRLEKAGVIKVENGFQKKLKSELFTKKS